MDKEKVAIRNGKAFKTNEVKVKQDYINANYKLILSPRTEITPTGLLTVGELKPKGKTLPGFLFRWDEKAESLDIDVKNVSGKIKKKFERGFGGYNGHHTKRALDDKNRIFAISIKIPGMAVFEGEISFGLHRELEVTVNSKSSISVSMEKRKGRITRRNCSSDKDIYKGHQ